VGIPWLVQRLSKKERFKANLPICDRERVNERQSTADALEKIPMASKDIFSVNHDNNDMLAVRFS
jgi:hypothetical protein